jgi:hypothetical protein
MMNILNYSKTKLTQYKKQYKGIIHVQLPLNLSNMKSQLSL